MFVLAGCALLTPLHADSVNPATLAALKWRLIGPFRAGRVSAGAVDPSDPNIYYFGSPGGGVWKTTNAGQTWNPLFDQAGVASVGALAVARSNTKVLYAGTGEETRGAGVFKSSDGGATWANVGLPDTHFIGSIIISPTNPDDVLVAAIGDRTPGPDRGVFRTTNGGRTWTKALFLDNDSGCPSIASAVDEPRVVYATLYPAAGSRGAGLVPPITASSVGATPDANRPPPRSAAVFKSIDGGATWKRLRAHGLEAPPIGRQALAVAAGSRGRVVFAGLRDGLFRSDDGGDTWTRATEDPRIKPVGVIADPGNARVLYVTQTALYRSTDGGHTFDAFAGAPSGDDYQLLWVDPHNSKRLLAGVDQGAVVSVDGGSSWSSWYNQPTGQFYHVVTDDRFPYHVFAAQQDSGSVAIPNRSDFGEISYRDWYLPGGFEFGYLAPDPLDADVVFAGGWYRTVVRFDRKTGQIASVFVPGTKYRSVNNAPMAFSPHEPRALYYGTQFMVKTTDGGASWREISPDLTQTANPPAAQRAPASITSFSISPVREGVIWAGTNNGIVQKTDNDGTTWRNVSPSGLPPRGTFEIIDAGRHDPSSAFAAYIVPNDLHPYIYRTRDGGSTWQKIVEGLPDTAFVRVVREDPAVAGLLYCGTESGVYVSVDAGDHWQSLQLNLPASSMRDIVVHGDDLVLATYGRGLWILDNLTPMRQLGTGAAPADLKLLKPAVAVLSRWDVNEDTPLPVETPTAPNPLEGAVIDYYLPNAVESELKMTIRDERGEAVRTYTSVAPAPATMFANVPSYWFAPPDVLSTHAGVNRFAWDFRYPAPKILPFGYFGAMLPYVEYTLADHAIPGRTPRDQPGGAFARPGRYTIELSGGGHRDTQTLVVTPDPRVNASLADRTAQLDLATRLSAGLAASFDGYNALATLRAALAAHLKAFGAAPDRADAASAVQAFDKKVDAVQSGTAEAPGLGPVNREMARLFSMVESADTRPSEPLQTASAAWCASLTSALDAWRQLSGTELAAANAALAQAQRPAITIPRPPAMPACSR
ncbi:MAG TPA: hypothetical protein VHU82_11035 [Vicinamibacterales bacterium]|jgi:photosystem II stability/assembly factor-like uncharacterized protein|nr:hypothetical protein [Vicinamibacterales bacterium]